MRCVSRRYQSSRQSWHVALIFPLNIGSCFCVLLSVISDRYRGHDMINCLIWMGKRKSNDGSLHWLFQFIWYVIRPIRDPMEHTLFYAVIIAHTRTNIYVYAYICVHTLPVGVPDCKVHWANMGPTWVLSAPDGSHVGPMNLAIRCVSQLTVIYFRKLLFLFVIQF